MNLPPNKSDFRNRAELPVHLPEALLSVLRSRTGLPDTFRGCLVSNDAPGLLRELMRSFTKVAITDSVHPGALFAPVDLHILRPEVPADILGLIDADAVVLSPMSWCSGDILDLSDALYALPRSSPRVKIILDLTGMSEFRDLRIPETLQSPGLYAVVVDIREGPAAAILREPVAGYSPDSVPAGMLTTGLEPPADWKEQTDRAARSLHNLELHLRDRLLPALPGIRYTGRALLRTELPGRLAREVFQVLGVQVDGPSADGPESPDLYTVRNYGENLLPIQLRELRPVSEFQSVLQASEHLTGSTEEIKRTLEYSSRVSGQT